MLRIALVGYGKMGKAIEQEALSRNHVISRIIDLANQHDILTLSPANTDVVIEFTQPGSFPENLRKVMESGVPLVTGTTGWYDQLAQVQKIVNESGGGLMYSSNFSIGVNILFKLNQYLAEMMNRFDQYDCFVEERHHRHKADAPSGTAYSLSRQILAGLDRKTRVAGEDLRHRKPEADELSVGYVRSGEIIGEHTVGYTSDIDTITISHTAHSRRGFALGAVVAAEWMVGKTGVYEFSSII
ncbi:MAG: 4-hydroxy-tetrahydrodipicolinate reductase [Bacteroidia bacterium]|nr:4-hydroxy-tetrahydrodipicolinate reductase [Bacteroidia bacterium]